MRRSFMMTRGLVAGSLRNSRLTVESPPAIRNSAEAPGAMIPSERPWCNNNCAEKRMSVPQEIFMPRRCANS
jgi:hypothetical protein